MTFELSDDGKLLFAINQSLLGRIRKDLLSVTASWNEDHLVLAMIYPSDPDEEAQQISDKVKSNLEQRIPSKAVEVYASTKRRDLNKTFSRSSTVFAIYAD